MLESKGEPNLSLTLIAGRNGAKNEAKIGLQTKGQLHAVYLMTPYNDPLSSLGPFSGYICPNIYSRQMAVYEERHGAFLVHRGTEGTIRSAPITGCCPIKIFAYSRRGVSSEIH